MPPKVNASATSKTPAINNQKQGDVSMPLSEQFSEDSLPFMKSEPDIKDSSANNSKL
jgi:hypothetical protein